MSDTSQNARQTTQTQKKTQTLQTDSMMDRYRTIVKSNTNVISTMKPILLTSITRPMFCLLSILLLSLTHRHHLARCQSSHFRPIQQPNQLAPNHANQAHSNHHNHHQNQYYSLNQNQPDHRHRFPNLSTPFGPQQAGRPQRQSASPRASGASPAPRSAWQSRNNFIATANERVRLEKLAQQQHQYQANNWQHQPHKDRGHHKHNNKHHQAHEHRQTKSINYPDKGALISDRRASASSWSPNHVLSSGQQVKFGQLGDKTSANSPDLLHDKHQKQQQQSQQQQSAANPDEKLLICYYTTRQTAPYWPKDAREFVIPADQLGQMQQQAAAASLQADQLRSASSVNVGSFNDRYPNYQHHQQQLDSHLHEKYTRTQQDATKVGGTGDNPVINAPNNNQNSIRQSVLQQQHFVDGRQMIVVAPKFVPFNQSTSASSTGQLNMPQDVHGGEHLAPPAFFMPPTSGARQHSITSRQDSATGTIVAAPMQQLIVATTTAAASAGQHQLSGGSENNSIAADQQRQRDNNNNGLVGGHHQDLGRTVSRQQQHQAAPYGVSSSSLAPVSVQAPANDLIENGATPLSQPTGARSNNGNGVTQQQQARQFAQQQVPLSSSLMFAKANNNRGYSGMLTDDQIFTSNNFNNNGDSLNNQQQHQHDARGALHPRQQLIIAPSPSRSLVAVAGGGPSTTTMPMNNNEPQPIFAPQLPNSSNNNNQNDNNNYYYFYNNQAVSSSHSPASSAANFATAASTMAPINELGAATPTSTTMALTGGAVGQQNNNQQQQQQQQQRAKSLQVAESELSPAHQLGTQVAQTAQSTSLAPVSMGGAAAAAATAETGGLDRHIMASAPPSPSSSPSSSGHDSYHLNGASTIDQLLAGNTLGSASTSTKSFSPFSSSSSSGGELIKFPSSQPIGDETMSGAKTTPSLATSGLSSGTVGGLLAPLATATPRPNGGASSHIITDDELLARQQQRQPQQQQQTSASSLSSALVSSPLSTMFDVFGAASQYLMRFKPSSLISPSSFAFNSNSNNNLAASDHNSAAPGHLHPLHHQAHHQHNQNSLKSNSTSLFSGSAASFISFPFSNSLLSASDILHQKSSLPLGNDRSGGGSGPSGSAGANVSSGSSSSFSSAAGSLLSRLTLQNNQPQQQRREDMCGRTIQTPERRIIGGEGARYGEFPYQVHIKIAKHQCGGALVDRQSIVTAAHCVYHFITRAPVSKLQIVIGAYDIEDEQYQELPPQYFKVNKVKLHPNFRFSASHPDRYDIAILKLDKPVKYTDNVLPVCLPGKDLKFENMVGTVTGFGKTDPSLSNRTRGIDLKIFPEMMCAGYEDGLKDACVGDSGGPLVVKTPVGTNGSFRWTLAGITSAGFGCAQSRQPGIYHRVSHTVDWILENLD